MKLNELIFLGACSLFDVKMVETNNPNEARIQAIKEAKRIWRDVVDVQREEAD